MRVMTINGPLVLSGPGHGEITTVGTGTVGCMCCAWSAPLPAYPPDGHQVAALFLTHRCEDHPVVPVRERVALVLPIRDVTSPSHNLVMHQLVKESITVEAKPLADPSTKPTFEEHRAVCTQCNAGPFNLCDAGADILLAWWRALPPEPFPRPWSMKKIAARVALCLRTPCSRCGAKLVKHRSFDLDIVCPVRLDATVDRKEAEKHDLFPIDTGPFSLGRRVD